MTDVARLGIAVDSTPVSKANAELSEFSRVGTAAGKSADNISTSTTRMGNSVLKAGNQVRVYGGYAKGASAHTANLVAQFNDIGVMLASGQSPFQLAMQQGTQINQIFAQMGGVSGAIKAVGAAFASMLNPINFATIGLIAGGAALSQWGMSAFGARSDAEALKEALDDANSAISEYRSLVEDSPSGGLFSEEYERRIGVVTEAARELVKIAKFDAVSAIESMNASLADSVQHATYLHGEVGDLGNLLDVETQLRGNITAWKDARKYVAEFSSDIDAMANGGSLDEMYAAALRVRDTFSENVTEIENMDGAQLEFWRGLTQSILKMEALGASIDAAKVAQDGLADAQSKSLQGEIERIGKAASMVSEYERQAELSNAIAQYGRDSAEVEAIKRDHAMQSVESYIRQNDLSGAVAQSLRDSAASAYDADVNAAAAAASLQNAEVAAKGMAAAMASAAGFSASLSGTVSTLEAEIAALKSGADVAVASQIASLRVKKESIALDMEQKGVAQELVDITRLGHEAEIQKVEKLLSQKQGLISANKAVGSSGAKAAEKIVEQYTKQADAIRAAQDPMEKYRQEMEKLAELEGFLSDDEMARAIRDLNVELADSIPLAGELTDTLVDGLFNGFKGTLSDMGNMFKRWLIEMISMAAKNQIMISLGIGGSVTGTAANAATGMLGGGGGILGSIGSIAGGIGGSLMTGFMSSAGGFLSGGLSGGLSAIGGQLSATVAGGFGLSSAAASIGAVAAPLLAVAGVFSFFSTKTKELDNGLRITVDGMDTLVESFRKVKKTKFWGLSSKTSTSYREASAAIADPIELAVAEIQGSVLNMSDVLGVGADAFEGFSTVVKISTKGMSEEEALREIQTQLTKVADEMAEITLAGYDVSIAGETASQTLTRLSTSLLAANNYLDALGLSLFDMSVSGAAAASEFADVFGGIEAMQSSLTAYFEAYYSDAEKLAYATRQFETAMNDLGVAIPETKDQFRALVDAADAIGNKELVGNLIKLAPLFDQIAQATGNAASAAERLVAAQQGVDTAYQAMLTAATNEQKRLEEEYAAAIAPLTAEMEAAQAAADAAKGSLDGAMSALDTYVTDEIARLNDEFEASKERLEGIAESAAEIAAMFEEALDRTYDAVVDSLNRQRDEIESSYTAQIDIVSSALAEAQDHAAKFAGAIAALNLALDTRPALNEVAELIGYRAAQAQLASFVSGSDFTEDQLDRVLGTLSTDTAKFFGNRADYEFDAAKTRGDMAALLGTLEGEANEPQIVLLEQQLDAMIEARDAQLAALDSQLAEAERIYEEAKGIAGGVDITNATLSDLRLAADEYISESAKANKIAAESAAELAALESQSEAQTAHLEEILAEAQAQYDAAVGAEQGIQSVDEGIAALSAAIDHYAETQVTLADVQAVNGPLIEALEAELADKLGAIDAELARFAHLATPIATLPQAISNLEAAILELAGAEAAASLPTGVSPIDTSSVLSASINSAYEDILGRSADPAGMSFYTGSGLTLDQIEADLRTSDEYRTNIFTNQIDALTQDILGRPATAADQAAAWAQWLDGASYNQIGAGMQSVAYLVAAEEAAAIPDYMDPSKVMDAPGFASGGVHSGGYRWVGENGPELEFTGPSRVYSTEQSRDLLGMGEMSRQIASLTEEVKRLREENAEMQSQNYRVAEKTSKTLTKWDRDGQPAERT